MQCKNGEKAPLLQYSSKSSKLAILGQALRSSKFLHLECNLFSVEMDQSCQPRKSCLKEKINEKMDRLLWNISLETQSPLKKRYFFLSKNCHILQNTILIFLSSSRDNCRGQFYVFNCDWQLTIVTIYNCDTCQLWLTLVFLFLKTLPLKFVIKDTVRVTLILLKWKQAKFT